jgi:hypothetical protein
VTESAPKPPTSRWSLVLRRVGRVLLWGLILLAGLALWKWWSLESEVNRGRDELALAVAEADAQGAKWRWEDLDPGKEVPEDRNSIRVVTRIGELLQGRDRKEAQQADGSDFPGDLLANRLLDDEDRNSLKELTADREEALTLARSLRDFPEGRFPVQVQVEFFATRLPHLQSLRNAGWLLELDAEQQLHRSHTHVAAQDIDATLHAGDALRDENVLVSQIVRIALRGIAVRRVERLLGMSEPNESTLARLQAHLTAEATERPAVVGLRAERAVVSRFFDALAGPNSPLASFLENDRISRRREPGTWACLNAWLHSYRVPGQHAEYLRWMNAAIAIVELPPEQQTVRWTLYEQDMKADIRSRPQSPGDLALLFIPQAWGVGEAGLRDQAHLNCAVATLAVERFRRAKQRWPETLAELVPAYLPAVPVDPYSGKPLLYKRFDDGVAIYSVGKNGVDDGGLILAAKNAREPDADLGLRLWDPPKRRQLPLFFEPSEGLAVPLAP